jgi:hypothetical protein
MSGREARMDRTELSPFPESPVSSDRVRERRDEEGDRVVGAEGFVNFVESCFRVAGWGLRTNRSDARGQRRASGRRT